MLLESSIFPQQETEMTTIDDAIGDLKQNDRNKTEQAEELCVAMKKVQNING